MISVERLTAKWDLALLEALAEGRFVTGQQAAQHIWSGRNQANRRLAELETSGYIQRTKDYHLRITIIRPTQAALDALVQRGIVPGNDRKAQWTWEQLHHSKIGHILHESQVNEVRFVLREACEGTSVMLKQCSCGPGLAHSFTYNGKKYQVRPDRFLQLRVPGTESLQNYFIEVDRGTKPIQRNGGWDVEGQLLAYASYFAAGQFIEQHVPQPVTDHRPAAWPFRVLITCSKLSRIEAIIDRLSRDPVQHRIASFMRAYSVFDDFLADPLGPVWIRECDPGSRCSLIDQWPGWQTF